MVFSPPCARRVSSCSSTCAPWRCHAGRDSRKTRLAGNLAEAGIEYLHLRGLGTPADGRAAARSGRHEEMHRIFADHLASDVAQADLMTLVSIIGGGRSVALMCFERDPAHCHRSLVVDALMAHLPLEVSHLFANDDDAD
jgi:uncharacterized protein (DUF488 family)